MLLYFRKWFRIFHEKLWVGRIMKFLTIVHNTHLHLSLISFRQCDGSTFSCHCHELGHNRWKLHGKIFYSLLLIIRLLCLVLQFKLIFSFSNKVWKPFTLVFRAFYKRTNAKYQIHHSLFNLSPFGLAKITNLSLYIPW